MANEVRVKASVDDHVSGPLGKIRDKFDTLGKSEGVKTLATGFGLGVGAKVASVGIGLMEGAVEGLTGILGESVRKAQEDEVANARLGQVLKANIPGWDGNTEAIDKNNSAGVKLGFTDDEMANSLAALIPATHNVAKAEEVRAAAMDLARLKGISLEEATQALVKVEAGRFKMLATLGIQLKAGATQEEALAAVRKVSAGQAEAFSKTTSGAMAKLSASVEEAQEKLGKVLLPVLADVANFLADDLIPAVEGFFGTLADILSPIAKVNDLLKEQGGLIGVVGDAWKFVTKPLKDAGDAFFELGYEIDTVTGKTHTMEADGRHAALMLGVSAEDLQAAWKKTRDLQGGATRDMDKNLVTMVDGADAAATGVGAATKEMADQFDANGKRVHEIAIALHDQMVADFNAKAELAKQGREDALAFARGLNSRRDSIDQAGEDLLQALKHPLSKAKRIAHLEGQLASKRLKEGLDSGDPAIHQAAVDWRESIVSELEGLRKKASTYGKNTGLAYAAGLGSDGVISAIQRAAHKATHAAKQYMEANSPPGPASPLHDIDKWGYRTGATWADSFGKGLGTANGTALRSLSGLRMPGMTTIAQGPGALGGFGGDVHIHVHGVSVLTPGAARALGDQLGPVITAHQQRQGVIPRFGSGQRG